MDWIKAKNYTIFFLFILNILLLGLNFNKNREYKITQDQKKSIISVLNKNNININTDIPYTFFPAGQLYMKQYNYDIIKLQKIFFGEVSNIYRTEEFGKTILAYNNQNLIVANNVIIYKNNKKESNIDFNQEYAEKKCSDIINRINENYAKMSIDKIDIKNNYITLRYIQRFNNYNIFNNSVFFKVYKNGIMECKFTYNEPVEIRAPKLDICSADEALFMFMNEIKGIYGNKNISVEKIDFGYFVGNNVDSSTSNIIAIPYYRIFAQEIEEPYYINAYNGYN